MIGRDTGSPAPTLISPVWEILRRQIPTVDEGYWEGMVRLRPDVPTGITAALGRPLECVLLQAASGAPVTCEEKGAT